MDELWKISVSGAGLGAVASFVIWSLYREWLRLPIFQTLTKDQQYRLFRLFLIFTFVFCVTGLTAYVITKLWHSDAEVSPQTDATIKREAWQIVTAAAGTKGDGGRRKALMDLNRLRESLRRLNVSYADLRGINLSGADCREADFSHCDLSDAILTGADFSYANLSHATLVRAKMSKANLTFVNLTEALFWVEMMSEVDALWAPTRKGTKPTELHIDDLYKKGVDLSGTNLRTANLQGAVLKFANLKGAILFNADLTGSNLEFANLTEAKLFQANLTKSRIGAANFTDADISWANLVELDLGGAADFRGLAIVWTAADLKEQILKARGWENAFFDDSITRVLGLRPNDERRPLRPTTPNPEPIRPYWLVAPYVREGPVTNE